MSSLLDETAEAEPPLSCDCVTVSLCHCLRSPPQLGAMTWSFESLKAECAASRQSQVASLEQKCRCLDSFGCKVVIILKPFRSDLPYNVVESTSRQRAGSAAVRRLRAPEQEELTTVSTATPDIPAQTIRDNTLRKLHCQTVSMFCRPV